jgi:hypothetical protein
MHQLNKIRTVQPQANLVTFKYININTKIWSKEKKEIFNSGRRRNISKNTYKWLLLKPFKTFYSGDL